MSFLNGNVFETKSVLDSGLFLPRNEVGDAAASIATTATMSVGDDFDGTIGTSGDHDWVAIDLVAGQSYVFSLWGTGGAAGVSDTVLSLRDNTGTLLATNDDVAASLGNLFSQIEFTASTTGTYYLDVSAYATGSGTYTLQAATNIFTVDQVVTQITEFGWGYTAAPHFDVQAGDTLTVNLTALTADGQQLARWALEAWSDVSGLTFSEVSSGGDIRFDDNQPGAFAGPSSLNPNTGIISYSEVNISTSWISSYGTEIDSYSYQTYLHEIGHALGLMHTGNYNGTATYGLDNHFLNDSYQMSIMSYFSAQENTFINGSYYTALGPMIGDIAAIQSLYGTNTTAHADLRPWLGNTVWGVDSNVGGLLGTIFSYISDGVTPDPAIFNGNPVGFTVFDAGGHDLIDLSNFSFDQTVSLAEGAASNVGGLTGNIVIAVGTVIEDLTTGAGNDTLTGNDAHNAFNAGSGTNSINGGAGYDRAIVNGSIAATSISGGTGVSLTFSGSGATTTTTGVELFTFTEGTVSIADLLGAGHGGFDGNATLRDVYVGTSGDDWANGLGGDDRLDGGTGNDFLSGGAGNDEILGRDGDDVLNGGEGDDNIAASDGNDTVYGGAGNDAIGGGYGNDYLLGESGNDVIGAGSGHDYIDAGTGNDVVSGGWGYDEVHGGDGNDTLAGSYDADRVYGGIGNDSLGGGTGDDILYAGDGDDLMGAGNDNDILYAGTGNDFLGGGSGEDALYGEGGNDRLNGGTGNDTLSGGSGEDEFIFTVLTNGERDVITDFEDGSDWIRMHGVATGTQIERFNALTINDVSGGVDISYNGHIIHVDGIASADLSVSDFIFL